MAVNLSFIGGAGWQFLDNNGVILSGGKIYTYAAGTSTPLATYTSRTGATPNANPIVLDSAGRTPEQIWSTEGLLYKYVVATSADVVLRTWDNIGGSVVASNLAADLAAPSGSSLVGFLQAGTSAVARTVQSKLRDIVSVKDFGAIGNGVADDTAAIQAAINASDAIWVPEGTYKVTDSLAVNKSMVIQVDGTITTTRYEYQLNPPTIFLVTADNVTIEGSGTLTGPGIFTHAVITNIQFIPSLIKVNSADNVTIQNLTLIDVPQAGVIYIDSDYIRIINNTFIGGDTVANCLDTPNPEGINYYAVFGNASDYGVLSNNRIIDDAAGNTFAEGFFLYKVEYTKVTENYCRNIVDHDVYMYHSSGDTLGQNNYNTIANNISYSNLTSLTQKIGSSYKFHGIGNLVVNNSITNSVSGITAERASYSIISGNFLSGFDQIGIVVSDLVSFNADGNNYVTISNNTLYGAVNGSISGIYFRGDLTYSTSNSVGGKITGNTLLRCGDGAAPSAPIQVFHSNTSAYLDGFLISDNVIALQESLCGMYLDQLRYAKITDNVIRNGNYTAWRGIQFGSRCTFNEVSKNIVRDDQNTPLLAIGCYFADVTDTDNIVSGNIMHSVYASRDLNPWGVNEVYRNTGDRNVNDDTLGYPVGLATAESVANVTASATISIAMNVPTGSRVTGAQIRVDAALAAGDLWDAAYGGGLVGTIATAQAVAKNTQAGALFNANGATDITTGTLFVDVTKNGGGTLTAQGTVRVLVYYEALTALGNAP